MVLGVHTMRAATLTSRSCRSCPPSYASRGAADSAVTIEGTRLQSFFGRSRNPSFLANWMMLAVTAFRKVLLEDSDGAATHAGRLGNAFGTLVVPPHELIIIIIVITTRSRESLLERAPLCVVCALFTPGPEMHILLLAFLHLN